jgi:hypothetical protein
MTPRLVRSIFVLALFTTSLALAQEKPAGKAKDKQEVQINEVENGFYFGATGGFFMLLNPPAGPGSKQYAVPGQSVMAEMGMDFGPRFSVALFALGASVRAGSDYTGRSQVDGAGNACGGNGTGCHPTASGDLASFVPGLLVRANLLGFDDNQDVTRTWIYVRAGAGYVFYQPHALVPGNDIMIFGGPGVEYHTKLRHFSIGLEADFVFMALTASLGFQIVPSLRYSF